jgi:hypothetical protein
MEHSAGTIGFREVDRDGNPVGSQAQPGAAENQPTRGSKLFRAGRRRLAM